MDRKGSKEYRSQASHPKQRRFQGNQFTVEKDVDIPSTLGEKLQNKEDLDTIISSTHDYCILKEE